MGLPKSKTDILHEIMGGRMVGGTLSELANYSDLFLRMSESVFLLDRNSLRVMECNPSALALLGLSEAEVLGQEIQTLLSGDPAMRAFLKNELSHPQLELKNREGEERFYETSATALKILDYIEVVQFMVRDITHMKRAERELREMNEALRSLSTTDEMTGLKNYRYLKEVMASVHHQAKNFKLEYGVIFLDVDHFKKFNDRNGHPAGDQVLKKVAEILRNTSRAQDMPCRYGGEEFVVLCRSSNEPETRAQAEKIRKAIEETVFPFGEFQPLGKVTASIGIAVFTPASTITYEEVLKSADEALYLSKEGGRNRVTSALDLKKKAA